MIAALILLPLIWLCVLGVVTSFAQDATHKDEFFYGHTKIKVVLVTLLWPVACAVLLIGAAVVVAGEVVKTFKEL